MSQLGCVQFDGVGAFYCFRDYDLAFERFHQTRIFVEFFHVDRFNGVKLAIVEVSYLEDLAIAPLA